MVTQCEIARQTGLDVSSVNKILNRRSGPVFRGDTVRKVFKAARDLGYDLDRLKHHHRRTHPRLPVTVETDLAIYRKDGNLFDRGSAKITDLSLGGALVSDVSLPQGALPLDPFIVRLNPRTRPLNEVELKGEIVRMETNGRMKFGVRFLPMEKEDLRSLEKAIER
jgi:c-di-GMP-binding flagellar brake protein YcgR